MKRTKINTKNVVKFAFAFMSVLLLIGFASALSFSTPNELSASNRETTLILTNNDDVAQTVSLSIDPITSDSNQVMFEVTPDVISDLNAGKTETVTVRITDIVGSFNFGRHITEVLAQGEGDSETFNASRQISFLQSFCKDGEKGDLVIRDVNINNEGDGNDDEWELLDDIEIEVEVENEGSDDIDDVILEIGLFDSSGDNVIDDLEFESIDDEEVELGNLNEDEKESHVFRFQVPADFEDGGYKLAIKAYSDDLGESNVCTDTSRDLDNEFFHSIDVDRETDEGRFIAFDNIIVRPEQATCGDSVEVRMDVVNIGDEDQDQVKVNLVSSDLNLDMSREIRNDLDRGDKQSISFTFVVPQGLEDKGYALELDAEYDFRREVYREQSDEKTRFPINVVGCGAPIAGEDEVVISAFLDSDARAGQELIVKSIITNLGTEEKSFIISASGFEAWANLDSISSRLLDLNSGESEEVAFSFSVNKDVEGQRSFLIEARSGDKIETREVAVNIQGAGGSGITGGVIGAGLGGNTLIWVIGIVNVILIILIIIVAVRLARR